MTWAGGTSDLLARPVARARHRRLSRLTAPTHGRAFWLTLWAAVAAAGGAALIPVVFGHGVPVSGDDVIHRLSGISFAACGVVAWRRRPDSAVGRLLTLAGFWVLLAPILDQIDSPPAFTLSALAGEMWIIVYATLILSFVSGGRLASAVDRALVGMFVLGLFVLQFAVMLFLEADGNLLLVHPDAGVASALTQVQRAVLIVASLAVACVIGARWSAASRPRRRALLPSLAGSLSGVLFAAWLTSLLVESPVIPLVWILNTALLTVPAALLWSLLRSRLARGGLADLFRDLGTRRGLQLETGLARTLGDPSLVLAYRVPGRRAYIDGDGRPVEPPAPGGDRTATPIERDDHELGMLVHDASLDDDPELVEAVAAAAAIALDDARLHAESEDRLAELRASRERLVAASDAERRRLERNLHDGAQQRLVSVALQLRMIQGHIHTDPTLAERLLSSASEELSSRCRSSASSRAGSTPRCSTTGCEPRSRRWPRARPCRPRSPSTAGAPARAGRARRLLRRLRGAGQRRQVRARHADARSASRAAPATRCVEIADDGVGGADESAGTGLQGLADRVAALGGLAAHPQPAGRRHRVTAELPCGS